MLNKIRLSIATRSMLAALSLGLVLGLPLDNLVALEQGSLKQCQRYRDQQQQYTEKRRRGGSKSQMRRWQQQRNHYSRLYSRQNCRVHRRYLK